METQETVQHELAPFIGEPIVIYDVGARGELQPQWQEWAITGHEGAAFVLFEPHEPAAAALKLRYSEHPQVQIVQAGLYNEEGTFTLNVTRHETCSSLLEPDPVVLSRYYIGPIFEVIEKVPVPCRRLDTIALRDALRPPDFCKLDVQGAEYEVLVGMGALLENCLAFEMETHLYPIYKGQKLLPEIIALLAAHGFTLRDLRPQRHFDADYVEVNAYFAKREDLTPPDRLPRLELIKRKLQLQNWPAGEEIVSGLEPRRVNEGP